MFVIYVIAVVSLIAAALWVGTELYVKASRKSDPELLDYQNPTRSEIEEVKAMSRVGTVRIGSSPSAAARHFARSTPQTRVRGGASGGEGKQIHNPSTSVSNWRDEREG